MYIFVFMYIRTYKPVSQWFFMSHGSLHSVNQFSTHDSRQRITRIYICIFSYTYIHIYIFICLHLNIYVYIYIHIYIYIIDSRQRITRALPLTEGTRVKYVWTPRLDSSHVHSFEWPGLLFTPWKFVYNFGNSRGNVFESSGDSR